MKNTKYHTVGTFPNPIEISSKEANSIPLTHKYMTAHFPDLIIFNLFIQRKQHTSNGYQQLSWLGTGTTMKGGVVKLVAWSKISRLRVYIKLSMYIFPFMSCIFFSNLEGGVKLVVWSQTSNFKVYIQLYMYMYIFPFMRCIFFSRLQDLSSKSRTTIGG